MKELRTIHNLQFLNYKIVALSRFLFKLTEISWEKLIHLLEEICRILDRVKKKGEPSKSSKLIFEVLLSLLDLYRGKTSSSI